MDKKRFIRILLFSGITLLTLILLAAGVDKILYTPEIVPVNSNATVTPISYIPAITFIGNDVIIYLLFIFLLLAFLALLLTREGRKRAGLAVILFLLLLGALYLTGPRRESQPTIPEATSPTTGQIQLEITPPVLPLSESVPDAPETPRWAVTLSGLGLALLIAVGVALFIRYLTNKEITTPLTQAMSEEATNTIDALDAGEDFEDAIMQCYAKMSRIISRDRGLVREAAMTPREFERSLIQLGFPNVPVHDLTDLFEEVRYGHFAASVTAIQIAKNSLNAIVAFCQHRLAGSPNE